MEFFVYCFHIFIILLSSYLVCVAAWGGIEPPASSGNLHCSYVGRATPAQAVENCRRGTNEIASFCFNFAEFALFNRLVSLYPTFLSVYV